MRKARLLLLRFSMTIQGSLSGLWRFYKKSHSLQIVSLLAAIPLVLALFGIAYVSFDRRNLPDLDAFIRFEPSTMGYIFDSNGHVLIELGKEHREITQYGDIPEVLRHAILSAEDRNFFSHRGVDYSVFPRLLRKINVHALIARVENPFGENDPKRASVFPQGGSTITQQLVRGYFLQALMSTSSSNTLQHAGFFPHVLALAIGVPGANQFLRKLEEMRLSLWIEGEMQKRYGSKRRAKEELFARYASFIYLGNGRYGFASATQYYFGIPMTALTEDDADKAALLAAIPKSSSEYAPTLADNEKPLRRRNQILALMVKNHFLSAQTAARCARAPIYLAAHVSAPTEAPAAVGNVLEELKGLDATLSPDIGMTQLLEGHIEIYSTINAQIQNFANAALENELTLYEQRHPRSKGLVQGSVVVLRNSDSAILAEVGGRRIYKSQSATFSDYNRVTQSMRQPGSAMKPIVYLAAFHQGTLDLNTPVSDAPISVATSGGRPPKWITNFDHEFKGIIPARLALAESRNAAAIWIVQQIGIDSVLNMARDIGIHTALHRYDSTALGASDVTLLELANAYRFMASGIHADPYVIARIQHTRGDVAYTHSVSCCSGSHTGEELSLIQEGLRGVVRLPSGTAHNLDGRTFPIPVMGKTGTTNDYRDALFVGSTYGPDGITVAVRIGFDDDRSLGGMETGGRAALPVFREVMLKTYQANLIGPAPSFPAEMEINIDAYLQGEPAAEEPVQAPAVPNSAEAITARKSTCLATEAAQATSPCELMSAPASVIYQHEDLRGRAVFTNE